MKTLEQTLREETKELLVMFLEKTKIQAEKEIEHAKMVLSRKTEDWCKIFGIEPRKNFYYIPNSGIAEFDFPAGFYNTAKSKQKADAERKARGIYYATDYIGKSIKTAKNHYENSLLKLVKRVSVKGLNLETLEIKRSGIGINIEMLLTDGEKTVRAWTIVAEGPVQRPHYRYLVK